MNAPSPTIPPLRQHPTTIYQLPPPPASLMELPQEILAFIINQLDMRSASKLTLVSKEIKDITISSTATKQVELVRTLIDFVATELAVELEHVKGKRINSQQHIEDLSGALIKINEIIIPASTTFTSLKDIGSWLAETKSLLNELLSQIRPEHLAQMTQLYNAEMPHTFKDLLKQARFTARSNAFTHAYDAMGMVNIKTRGRMNLILQGDGDAGSKSIATSNLFKELLQETMQDADIRVTIMMLVNGLLNDQELMKRAVEELLEKNLMDRPVGTALLQIFQDPYASHVLRDTLDKRSLIMSLAALWERNLEDVKSIFFDSYFAPDVHMARIQRIILQSGLI